MRSGEANTRIVGQAISAGFVIGKAFVYREKLETLAGACEIEKCQVEEELLRIEQAMETVAGDLRVSAARIEAHTNARLSAIFEAHQAILQDPALRREIREMIEGELVGATHALARVFRRWELKFRSLSDKTQRQFADDIADLGKRLLRQMAGVTTTCLEKMPAGRVLVARRLLPSDTVALPRSDVAGIVLEFGGPGSHAALLAEALAIPTVAQIPKVTERIDEDDLLIVNGFAGEIVINPDPEMQEHLRQTVEGVQVREVALKRSARQPACTVDGTTITVLANVGSGEEVLAAVDLGAEGVGLYRLEQFYLARTTPPTAPELLRHLEQTFAPMTGRKITVRLLDLGGDKPLPFLRPPPEENPFLGQRGVRFLLRYPDLLQTQAKAFLEFARDHDLHVLVPMVTLPDEMDSVRGAFTRAANAASRTSLPPLGAMIETPAAALSIPELAAHSDFFSIGTNDLTQFTMAAGRENPLVNGYFREDHPAVLRLVAMIIQEAGSVPVAVCGELARQLDALPKLLNLGVRTISVAPPLIPGVKGAIRQLTLGAGTGGQGREMLVPNAHAS